MSATRSVGIAVLVTLLLAGCASGARYQRIEHIPEGKALVYVYRPSGFAGSAVVYDVRVGDTAVGTLKSGSYFTYVASAPSELELWARTEAKSSITLDLKPGGVYYVRGGTSIGFLWGRPRLEIVSAEIGAKEIADCRTEETR
jgi:hypothetical protein